MYFGDWLSRWNVYSPNKVGLIDYPDSPLENNKGKSGREFTYAELYRRSNRVANYLREHGLRRGDRVAILAQNGVEHIDLFFATAKLGAMLVPLNYRLTFSGLEYLLNDTSPKLFFATQEYDELAQSLARAGAGPNPISIESELQAVLQKGDATPPPEIRLEQSDPHLILYTSGTTGHPKGALITHGQILWNSVNTAISLRLTGDDISTIHTPFYHTGGWNVLGTPLLHFGGQLVLMGRWNCEIFLEIIAQHRVTLFFGLPTLFKMLMASPRFNDTDFSSVRIVMSGGEPCPLSVLETFARRGMPIRQGYGLTEVGPNVYSLPAADAVRKAGSVGFPNFHVEARIVDDRMNEAPRGQVGELIMAGPMVCGGYWRKPEATAEAIVDGWFRTGDLFRQDEDGYY
ncbi:MAG: class I adenylate-forming enzyme family protein, partial [bacterium]